MDPRKLRRWLILIGVLYLLFPRDLIFDLLGRGVGLIDDAALIALLTWIYRRYARAHAAGATRESAGHGGSESPRAQTDAESAFDPYEVLGVSSAASAEAIDAAYKDRMKDYHPDRVAHLGEELQELAHRKTLEIQRAYRQLRR